MTSQTLRISETVAKLTASGAKNLGVLLAALAKDNIKIKGKTNINTMLKEGKELKVFGIQGDYLKEFAKEAKKYGVLYSVIKDVKSKPPTFDILARAEDVSKMNRIFELINYPIPDMNLKKTENNTPQKNKSTVQKSGLNTKTTAMKNNSIKKEADKIKNSKTKNTIEKER